MFKVPALAPADEGVVALKSTFDLSDGWVSGMTEVVQSTSRASFGNGTQEESKTTIWSLV